MKTKKVIRIILWVMICVLLLMTFLFVFNFILTKVGYYQSFSWVNFLLRFPINDFAIVIFMGWILIGLIVYAFPEWF